MRRIRLIVEGAQRLVCLVAVGGVQRELIGELKEQLHRLAGRIVRADVVEVYACHGYRPQIAVLGELAGPQVADEHRLAHATDAPQVQRPFACGRGKEVGDGIGELRAVEVAAQHHVVPAPLQTEIQHQPSARQLIVRRALDHGIKRLPRIHEFLRTAEVMHADSLLDAVEEASRDVVRLGLCAQLSPGPQRAWQVDLAGVPNDAGGDITCITLNRTHITAGKLPHGVENIAAHLVGHPETKLRRPVGAQGTPGLAPSCGAGPADEVGDRLIPLHGEACRLRRAARPQWRCRQPQRAPLAEVTNDIHPPLSDRPIDIDRVPQFTGYGGHFST